MRKFFSLLKLQINAQYGFSNALYNIKHDKKAFWKGVGIGIAILLALGEVIGIYTFLMYQLYSGAAMINAPQNDIDDGGDMFRADSTDFRHLLYYWHAFSCQGH